MNDRMTRISMIAISVIGLVDAVYLTWVKLAHQPIFCGTYGGCETVATSKYAAMYGIPIATFGALAYAAILAVLFLESRGGFWIEYSPFLVFGISLAGVVYSIYLTYLEIAVIHAICPYCVVSAIAITLVFLLSVLRLVRGSQAETKYI